MSPEESPRITRLDAEWPQALAQVENQLQVWVDRQQKVTLQIACGTGALQICVVGELRQEMERVWVLDPVHLLADGRTSPSAKKPVSMIGQFLLVPWAAAYLRITKIPELFDLMIGIGVSEIGMEVTLLAGDDRGFLRTQMMQ